MPEQQADQGRVRPRARWLRRALLAAVALVVLVIGLPWGVTTVQSHGRILSPDELDASTPPVALVLGAQVLPGGTPSLFLQARLDLAASLYQRGDVTALLVSGTAEGGYDEPEAMKRYLVAAGVPEADIVKDVHGDATYDSCVRARAVYGLDRVVLVSQRYHLPRAITACRAVGVDAIGVGDETVASIGMEGWPSWMQGMGWWRFVLRERLAAPKLLWELATHRSVVLGPRDDSVLQVLQRRR